VQTVECSNVANDTCRCHDRNDAVCSSHDREDSARRNGACMGGERLRPYFSIVTVATVTFYVKAKETKKCRHRDDDDLVEFCQL
jgi:hypothetical protein